jgi:hypothetical protein
MNWGGRVQYFLEQMEAEAKTRVKHSGYERMLKSLLEEIESRINGGRL